MTRHAHIRANENQLRAGYRLLQGMLHSDNPQVQREVAMHLHDSRPADAFAFVQLCCGALLVNELPDTPLYSHARTGTD